MHQYPGRAENREEESREQGRREQIMCAPQSLPDGN